MFIPVRKLRERKLFSIETHVLCWLGIWLGEEKVALKTSRLINNSESAQRVSILLHASSTHSLEIIRNSGEK
jgi:hypothetical protein